MSAIAQHRLHNQLLTQSQPLSPGEVVARLGALQAQDFAGALWSLGLRLAGSTEMKLKTSLSAEPGENNFVRTWALRGTYHFVALNDLDWLLKLVGPGVIAKNARRYHQLALDETTLGQSTKILAESLTGGVRLERRALLEILEQHGISTQGQRGVYMLQRASLEGLICQTAVLRGQPVFQRCPIPDPSSPKTRSEALAELARRYFFSRGPAGLADFGWWSGLSAADARAGLDMIRSELVQETIAGKIFWYPKIEYSHPPADQAFFLPGFDEFLVSYKDRSASITPEHMPLWTKSGAMFSPTLVLNGQVVGLWKRVIRAKSVLVMAQPFARLSSTHSDLFHSAALRYADFLGKTLELVFE